MSEYQTRIALASVPEEVYTLPLDKIPHLARGKLSGNSPKITYLDWTLEEFQLFLKSYEGQPFSLTLENYANLWDFASIQEQDRFAEKYLPSDIIPLEFWLQHHSVTGPALLKFPEIPPRFTERFSLVHLELYPSMVDQTVEHNGKVYRYYLHIYGRDDKVVYPNVVVHLPRSLKLVDWNSHSHVWEHLGEDTKKEEEWMTLAEKYSHRLDNGRIPRNSVPPREDSWVSSTIHRCGDETVNHYVCSYHAKVKITMVVEKNQ